MPSPFGGRGQGGREAERKAEREAAIHLEGTDVADAYGDVVDRFLGKEKPMRFVDYQKPGLLSRLFGNK